MKKLLFIIPIFLLFLVGCNLNPNTSTTTILPTSNITSSDTQETSKNVTSNTDVIPTTTKEEPVESSSDVKPTTSVETSSEASTTSSQIVPITSNDDVYDDDISWGSFH
ncbi:MAG: hypothetical protein IKP77_04315 [Acholeplasmatales bacterium]|nr:hypothetical protein [Acholeplasmatales bacterium]